MGGGGGGVGGEGFLYVGIGVIYLVQGLGACQVSDGNVQKVAKKILAAPDPVSITVWRPKVSGQSARDYFRKLLRRSRLQVNFGC